MAPTRRITPQPKPIRVKTQVLPAPVYNSGGFKPNVILGVQKPKPTRPLSNLSSGNVLALVGSSWIIPLQFNSGGLIPLFTQGAKRKNFSRALSRIKTPDIFNSGSLVPLFIKGVKRPPPTRTLKRTVLSTSAYNSGGLNPLTFKSTQKFGQRRNLSKILIPPQQTGLGIATSPSPIYVGLRRKPPTKPGSSVHIAPSYNSDGITPVFIQVVRRKNFSRSGSHIVLQPAYNSGGISSTLLQGKRRRNLHRPSSQVRVAPIYNSGGIVPIPLVSGLHSGAILFPTNPVQGVKRKYGPGAIIPIRPSQLQVPPTLNAQTAHLTSIYSDEGPDQIAAYGLSFIYGYRNLTDYEVFVSETNVLKEVVFKGKAVVTSDTLHPSDSTSRTVHVTKNLDDTILTTEMFKALSVSAQQVFIAPARLFTRIGQNRFRAPNKLIAQSRPFTLRGVPTQKMSLIDVQPSNFDIATTEQIPLNFDTSLLLLPSETISSPSASVVSVANNQPNASALSGTPSVAGNIITVTVNASQLASGQQYYLLISFVPATNKTVTMRLTLSVIF